MLTVTCILLERQEVRRFLRNTGFNAYEFASPDWELVVPIRLPYISVREKLYLDGVLFKNSRKKERTRLRSGTKLRMTLAKNAAESQEMVEQYLLFYRYYPH